MSSLDKYFISILMLLSVSQYVFSIKCFDCRSDTDPKCADPFDNSTIPITNCVQEGSSHLPGLKLTNMCRKMKQKVNGVWIYCRGCAYLGEVGIQGEERFCLKRTGSENISIEDCDNKDGCNSSSFLSPIPFMLVIFSFVAYNFKTML